MVKTQTALMKGFDAKSNKMMASLGYTSANDNRVFNTRLDEKIQLFNVKSWLRVNKNKLLKDIADNLIDELLAEVN